MILLAKTPDPKGSTPTTPFSVPDMPPSKYRSLTHLEIKYPKITMSSPLTIFLVKTPDPGYSDRRQSSSSPNIEGSTPISDPDKFRSPNYPEPTPSLNIQKLPGSSISFLILFVFSKYWAQTSLKELRQSTTV